jgi:aminomethyltransferase
VLITSEEGGIINDPILLRLGENHFWLSLADSDVLLWAKGLAVHSGMDVSIGEPDVSPLQLQGPKSLEIMKALFGEEISTLRYFFLRELELDGIPLVVSRTGWSGELGYEIYLRDASRGDELWERIMAAGKPFGLRAGHTSTIRRIEAGMLSYHADMDIHTNPFELGLDRLVDLDMPDNFIGKATLKRIKAEGIRRKQVGLEIAGLPVAYTAYPAIVPLRSLTCRSSIRRSSARNPLSSNERQRILEIGVANHLFPVSEHPGVCV